VSYSGGDGSATINVSGKPAFTKGGLLTVSDEVTSAAGASLSGTDSFLIGKRGKTITPE
jgi:hypothetical protein